MKKNAFTIIELLAVLVVIAIVLAIVVPTVIDTVKNSKERAYQTTIESVKTAAQTHINFSSSSYKAQFASPGYVTISLTTLIDEGYLKPDIKNPKTGEALTGSVKVTRESENKYIYEFIE